ncbi:MAG: alkaline phosphatase family protein [Thermodesulfobacteriota bacterium]|nr:alkaline phosphatase family protein [Thermodesulfobacteriota bacterium]
MPRKCLLVLLDGLGDRSFPLLGEKTPLQVARTPNLDMLASRGANGLYHASLAGQALPSENAHFSMFGYDMAEFPGRGALEALGAEIGISPADVAVLAHFVSLSEKNRTLVLDHEKPDAGTDDLAALGYHIRSFHMEDIVVSFHPTGGIRGIVTLSGDVARFVTDSDPVTPGRPMCAVQPWADYADNAPTERTARVLHAYLAWAYHHLNTHEVNRQRREKGLYPVNGLVTQRAGQLKQVIPFARKYGLKGLIMASGMVYWGLGKYIGMDVKKVTDSHDPGTDLAQRMQMAHDYLADYDFVHVHTKAPDEAGHTKKPMFKKRVIESLDAGIGRVIKPILDDPDVLVVVTADHTTPSSGPLIHSGETVPLMMVGPGIRQDKVVRFDEVNAANGCLGGVRGRELMLLILNHLERAKLAGIMDTPVDQPYWPGEYTPLDPTEPVP